MSDVFEKRLRRAEVLRKEWPFASEILDLFSGLTKVQNEMLDRLQHRGPVENQPAENFRRLLDLVRSSAPAPLADRAKGMDISDLGALEQRVAAGEPLDPAETFFWRIIEQPLTMSVVRPANLQPSADPPSACPFFCELPPLVSVLREDKQADTVRRTLLCPRCCNEWDFPRVLCPSCKEEKPEKLPRYSAQEIPWMRVEACDSCGKYLKSVDLTLNWDAEPVVDELASTPLDVIAHEHGYTKITPNLAGI
jgi:FdhE protein